MSWFEDNIVNNPILNPAGWVATQIRNDNGGTANERVESWAQNNQELLPGCIRELNDPNDTSPTNPCNFQGTEADWEAFRTNWINDCTSANNNGILTSKNKTLSACQAKFDELAAGIQVHQYRENSAALSEIKSLVSKNSPFLYIGGFLFVALIIYLLMSKD